MRILALVLARGGSKRCPGKNIRMLGGKPLIVWSIDAAKGVPEICDILVSTDDPAIADVARSAGAMVPWLRPLDLASDTASSVDAAIHALDWYEAKHEAVDGLLLLQPTSPFRNIQTLNQGINLFITSYSGSVVSVSPTHTHPLWSFTIMNNQLKPLCADHGLEKRSQDLPSAYIVNGSFYLITSDLIRKTRTFFSEKTVPLVMESRKEALDIDDEWDFKMAECMLKEGE